MLKDYEKLCMRVREIKYGDQWPLNLPYQEDPVRPELDRAFRHTAGREVYTLSLITISAPTRPSGISVVRVGV